MCRELIVRPGGGLHTPLGLIQATPGQAGLVIIRVGLMGTVVQLPGPARASSLATCSVFGTSRPACVHCVVA